MDRKKEYELLIRQTLKSLGCNKLITYEQLKKADKDSHPSKKLYSDYELTLLSEYFFSVVSRLIQQKPRNCHIHSSFSCKGNELGIDRLINKIKSGDNINKNLSERVFEIEQARLNDSMLSNWGIHHFHIPKEDGNRFFVNRTNELLFAKVESDTVYFIDIQPHSNKLKTYAPWVDIKIFSSIEEQYPETIERFLIGAGKTPYSAKQLKNARSKNCEPYSIITNKGNEYRNLGAGNVSTGLCTHAIRKTDEYIAAVNKLPEDSRKLFFNENYELCLA